MQSRNKRWFSGQVEFLQRQYLQDNRLPFSEVLSEKCIAQALSTVDGWLDRIYSPLVTLWVFLGQVLSADHSCRAAVARLIAHRLAHGQSACSSETSAYCQARKRLPEKFSPKRRVRPAELFKTTYRPPGSARSDVFWFMTGRRSRCPIR